MFKKLLLTLFILLSPIIAHATTTIPWITQGSGFTDIRPNRVNGVDLPLAVPNTATSTFAGSISVAGNAQAGKLCLTGDLPCRSTWPVGTVTSVDVSGGSSGLNFTGGPITSSGTITLGAGSILDVTYGGTGFDSAIKGDIVYATAANTLGKLAIGTENQLLRTGSAGEPEWTSGISVTTLAVTDATATSTLAGGIITAGLSSSNGLTVTGGNIFSSGTLNITSTATSTLAGGLSLTNLNSSTGIEITGGSFKSAGALEITSALSSSFVGNVGIGSTSPYAKLSIKGAGSTTGVNFQTTNSSDGSLVTMLDSGNVGLSTTTPSALLEIGKASILTSGQSTSLIVNGAGTTLPTNTQTGIVNIQGFGNESINRGASMTFSGNIVASGNFTPRVFAGINGFKENTTASNEAGYLAFSTNNNGTLTEGMRVSSTGLVGIGTTTPSKTLSVQGNALISGDLNVAGITATGTIAFTGTGTTTFTGGVSAAGLASSAGLTLTGGDILYNTPKFRVSSSGSVGIGTTSPTGKFAVGFINGSNDTRSVRFTNGVGYVFRYDDNSTIGPILQNLDVLAVKDHGTRILWQFGTDTDTFPISSGQLAVAKDQVWTSTASTRDSYMAFNNATNGSVSEKARLTSDGFFGVGTTSPLGLIEANATDSNTAVTTMGLANVTAFNRGTTANNRAEFLMRSRNTTVGTAYTGAKIGTVFTSHTDGAETGEMYFVTMDAGALAERMRLTSTGLGIGTTTPTSGLSIYGSGQTTSALDTDGSLGGALKVIDSGTSIGNGGAVLFGFNNTSIGKTFAAIKGLATNGSTNSTGDLAFSTRNATTDATLTERMIIKAGGNVGIGTTTPTSKLQVDSTTGTSQVTISGRTTGGCIMLRDTDDAGWTEVDSLDGVLTASIDADGICD